ncbi:uncharacterized protein LOC111242560 [Vigna radiata var. radiata]|uniref:Uncharacterized protein LOC111242560 n=1 Tax=Vigna radiata var. radiata TaxID=3916 RepID=A0A3Q0FEB5_VIGRR|nr:uncharacterized protein LOC111242560 [Vigna radiata var. radiata]
MSPPYSRPPCSPYYPYYSPPPQNPFHHLHHHLQTVTRPNLQLPFPVTVQAFPILLLFLLPLLQSHPTFEQQRGWSKINAFFDHFLVGLVDRSSFPFGYFLWMQRRTSQKVELRRTYREKCQTTNHI